MRSLLASIGLGLGLVLVGCSVDPGGVFAGSQSSAADSSGSSTPSSSNDPAPDAGTTPDSGEQVNPVAPDAGSTNDPGSNDPNNPGSAPVDPSGGQTSDDAGSNTGSTTTTGSAPAATWSSIYTAYLGPGTIGGCTSGCHATVTSAETAYSFIEGYGFFKGTQSTVSQLFSWMGGVMPPSGPTSNAQATSDVDAWVAAGALDN